jgi:hypothetical protein
MTPALAERYARLQEFAATLPPSPALAPNLPLPATVPMAMARINALLPFGAPALRPEDVFAFIGEASSSRHVPARRFSLHTSTLRNLAATANQGLALMSSHRSGMLGPDVELPVGKVFTGRVETQEGVSRVLVGAYLLRGIAPNGANGPSSDDLAAMIKGGVAFDLSPGLHGGRNVCDLCGREVLEMAGGRYACPHLPGSHEGMTSAEIARQKARGVEDGAATYSLHDYKASELSLVFDGAVEGARVLAVLST